ncbi:TFG isoform X1 [Brachionus plicatilis]|uniref:TFG isoform X1 n=1 Tax=Brachionus plicatilis TaxID=10195 RepID=A0A3M7SKV1_BRAPC|nr:TFG isoform X1 [Brachionus plicatilis]
MDGKILFKVKLNDQIKKIMIHNDDLNYNDLVLMLQRIFSDKIKQNDEFSLKYTDEENDLVTIQDDADVSLALQTSKVLKLTIFMKEEDSQVDELKPSEIVAELKHIRQAIDKFLTNFERAFKSDQKLDQITKATEDIKVDQVNHVNPEVQKEFDPLNKKEPFVQNIQKNSRAQTPDSVCSNEMTGRTSPRVHPPSYQQPMVHPQYQSQMQQQAQNQAPQQHPSFAPSAPSQQQIGQNQAQQQPSHPGMMQNPALKPPSQMPYHSQMQPGYMPQGMPQAQMHQPNAPVEPQQQYYQHQQQQFGQPPGGLQNQGVTGYNPYSKNPNMSLARPPSTTIYQQGYK